MKRFSFLIPFGIVVLGITAPIAAAQESAERGPDGDTTYHVAGIETLSVPDKPFVAKDSIEWTRSLEDGSTVTTHLFAVVARDSKGRIYRERRISCQRTAAVSRPSRKSWFTTLPLGRRRLAFWQPGCAL